MDEPSAARLPTSCLSLADFEALVGLSAIRTWVDWESLSDANCTVRMDVVPGTEALRRCQTVWYRNRGTRSEWRDQNARRVRVGEEAERSRPQPWVGGHLDVPQVFPALDLGGGEVMLLDGNHRAVALAGSPQPSQALLLVLAGPRDPLVFPDLVHEVHGADPPSVWRARIAEIDAKFGGS